jgi:type VI secretion system VasI/ImpG family protein/type VI secretion system ImpH/TssG family protein
MDPRLLAAYEQELSYLRETAREFGEEHEAVARQLGPHFPDEPDPYVERLLEGVAFLAARVKLKLDDQFPEFTQQLLNAIQPNYTAPTPAIGVTAFEAHLGDPGLAAGMRVERHTEVTATAPKQETPCRFRTSQAVDLWPIRLSKVEYLSTRAAVAAHAARAGVRAEAGLLLEFEATGDAPLGALPIDDLPIFLSGGDAVAGELYRQVLGDCAGVIAGSGAGPSNRVAKPEPWGFAEDCAVLPQDGRAFRGYRLLSEYFACPERFLFFRLGDLRTAFRGADRRAQVILLFSRSSSTLTGAVSTDNLRLFCSPVINLFEMQLGRTPVKGFEHEFLVMPDRTRPLDFEVFRLLDVVAHDMRGQARPVAPLYASGSLLYDRQALFFTTRLKLRRLPTKTQRLRARQDYVGSETWISLTAPNDPDRVGQVRELAIRALVTNRELPDLLKLGGRGGGIEAAEAPVAGVSFVRAPSKPRPPQGLSDAAWRVIAHLTPNYATLVGGDPVQNASTLRDRAGAECDRFHPAADRRGPTRVRARTDPARAARRLRLRERAHVPVRRRPGSLSVRVRHRQQLRRNPLRKPRSRRVRPLAAETGPAPDHLSWLRSARAEMRRFGFFALVRGAEARARDLPPVGRARHPSEDVVELAHAASLDFAASTLEGIESTPSGRMRVRGHFLGLTGPMGPLPLHVTEYAAYERRYAKSAPFGAFLDLISNRMLQFFYRAWADSQPAAQADRPGEDRFAGYVAAVSGAHDGTAGRDAFAEAFRLRFAGLFATRRSAAVLQDAIAGVLGLPVKVREFIGRWRDLSAEDQTRLGREDCRLGCGALLGARVRVADDTVRLTVRAPDLDAYQALTPGGDRFGLAAEAITAFLPSHLDWELELELPEDKAQGVVLGRAGRLGWSSWVLARSEPGRTRADARLTAGSRAAAGAV